jgi:uncharacterized protein YpuA (DUF1002 family)
MEIEKSLLADLKTGNAFITSVWYRSDISDQAETLEVELSETDISEVIDVLKGYGCNTDWSVINEAIYEVNQNPSGNSE